MQSTSNAKREFGALKGTDLQNGRGLVKPARIVAQ
jgi:hypothetical protein